MPGYHLREIPRGTFGRFSKVEEEFEEFIDALEQDCIIMAFMELSDFLLALEGFYKKIDSEYNFDRKIERVILNRKDYRKERFSGIENKNIAMLLGDLFRGGDISLNDILSIINDWLRLYNLTLKDVRVMSNITRRVFDEGHRTAK